MVKLSFKKLQDIEVGASLQWVLGDQLNTRSIFVQDECESKHHILFIESRGFAQRHKHHKQKLVFQFSAMRHFALELQQQGHSVVYVNLQDGDSAADMFELVDSLLSSDLQIKVSTMAGAEHDARCEQLNLQDKYGPQRFKVLPNDQFIATEQDLQEQFPDGKTRYLMENFYRHLRSKHRILMTAQGKPEGGRWNFDKENRKSIKDVAAHNFCYRLNSEPDEITLTVISDVERYFTDHYGKIQDFKYPVTRVAALKQLNNFIEEALPNFGDFQDAMLCESWHLYHCLLSTCLNFGLLHPLEVVNAVELAYRSNPEIPLNAVEGFIRQILGWREYVHGVYRKQMPSYRSLNYFQHRGRLPDLMWSGQTDMNCMKHCIGQTIERAYAHHIQRLMVIGNFCLLAGISPQEVCEWYLIVYIDAFEWVELPNTLGMSQYADGGILATKPYISSGKYINRMSNYCKNCKYNVDEVSSENACPFNFMYWNFLDRHREFIKGNARMAIALKNLQNKSDSELSLIADRTADFLNSLER